MQLPTSHHISSVFTLAENTLMAECARRLSSMSKLLAASGDFACSDSYLRILTTFFAHVCSVFFHQIQICIKTSCARGDTICPRPSPPPVGAVAPRAAEPTAAPADGNVTAVSHAQCVPTLTAAATCA